jgi:ABC-type multidrug transport system permease subunit
MRRLPAIGQLLLWTLRDFTREPAVLFWTIGFPLLMTLTLGQMTSKPRDWRANVALLVEAKDMEKAKAWLQDAPLKDKVSYTVMLPDQLPRALATGKVRLGLEKPWDPAQRAFHFDAANQDAQLCYYRMHAVLSGAKDETQPMNVAGARYVDFLMPGMLALGLVSSCLWGIGWNLVEMRQKKLLRLMLASPLKPGTFFTSLYLGRLITAVAEVAILLGFSRFLFQIHVLGSFLALSVLWVCGLAAFFGLAVLVASRTSRPAVGQGLINAVTLPMFVISGVFFGLDNFSPFLQKLFRLFPPTLLVDATRQVMSAGAGLAEVAPACVALGGMGLLCFGLGYKLFRFY